MIAEEQEIALPELTGNVEETQLAADPALDEWLAERRTMLGGTDMAAVLGFSPWRTAWDVAAEKKGLIPPQETSERMQWGTLLEEPIAREYGRRTGQRIRRVNQAMRHPAKPFLGGHPDRLVIGRKKGVEVKTVDGSKKAEWSEPGEPLRVPKPYYIQVQHYMAISGFEAWDLVPLIGMRAMRIYPVPVNERVVQAIVDRGEEFWNRYCIGPDLPPIEPSAAAEAYLKHRYGAPLDTTIKIADEREEQIVRRWLEAKRGRELYEQREATLKIKVQQLIGDASGVRAGPDLMVTWRKDRDTVKLVTDYEAILRDLGCDIPVDLIIKHSKSVVTREGPRKLLVKEAK